ncbi:MAG: TetR/AcrR family transcriptional regulator, partial [Brevibacterium sp.]|nr:TetR/AcrR family transcriptional regulator [Brevibacterium sp.]
AGTGVRPTATSAVQNHLLEIFLPFLEFFAGHEDLSRDYAAALMRVVGKPQVFEMLAADLQDKLSSSLVSIGISEAYAQASAAALYDSYLGILFRWAASDMGLDEATEALSHSIAFHTQLRRPV